MDALTKIGKQALRELLSKGWMTHDAMWLYHCLQECGMEKANRINKAAVESMSQIEILRMKKALGKGDDDVSSFEDLAELVTAAMDLVKADFMKFEWSIPKHNILQWKWKDRECFAYEGIKKLGVIDQYDCGIMTRIEGWFKGLGIAYTIDPPVNGCMMHEKGACSGRFEFHLKKRGGKS
ncbi:MAG: hypothetical protein GY849_22895 [Deltaproteobacteria bacterium]|nr:hypothetical protein [Deltaproteobacteria bacterium]